MPTAKEKGPMCHLQTFARTLKIVRAERQVANALPSVASASKKRVEVFGQIVKTSLRPHGKDD